MSALAAIGDSLREAFFMFWETLWALVLGFGLSGAVQAFVSRGLVVELGIVLWLLAGWQFALAEFAGGAIMIALLGVLLPRLAPPRLVSAARERLESPTA